MTKKRRSKRPRRRRLSKRERESIKRIRWILGIATTEAMRKGLKAEEKGVEALEYHKKKKTEFPGGRVIKEVRPTMHYSQEDIAGVDIEIEFQTGEILPIQIQSWWSSNAAESYREKGICLIAIFPHETREMTREKVFSAISNFYVALLIPPQRAMEMELDPI